MVNHLLSHAFGQAKLDGAKCTHLMEQDASYFALFCQQSVKQLIISRLYKVNTLNLGSNLI
jgi:hypothetical protein